MFHPIIEPISLSPPVILSKETEIKTPKTVVATISSKLLAASIISEIPFLAPYFLSINNIRDGTKTAVETVASQNPFVKHNVLGRENNNLLITVTVIASIN